MSASADSERGPTGNGRAVFWLIVTTFLWGGSFVFNKIGLREVSPILFMTVRFALAALVLGAVAGARLRALTQDAISRGILIGLALAAANLTFVFGVSGTTVSRAGFLNNLFVLIIPLFCFLFWKSRIDRFTLAGVGLAALGLAQLAWGAAGGFSRGDLFSTVCAFFISLHILAVSRLLRQGEILAVTWVQLVTVAICGSGLLLVVPQPPSHFSMAALGALAYCVVFPTVICFSLQNTFQRYVTPTQAGLIYTLDPIWSLLGGMLILGERLTPREWLGCALIFAAVVLPLAGNWLAERHAPQGGS